MTAEAYNPDEIMKNMTGGGATTPAPAPSIAQNRETAPLNQSDAIILKDQKEEFDRSPIPVGRYTAMIDKADFKFGKDGKPVINVTWRVTGPSQVNRVTWLNLAPRSHDFGAIMLKKFLMRTQKADSKGEYHSLIDSVDTTVGFDEKKFCDLGIAIGAEATLVIGMGKPYKNQAGEMQHPNSIKDIMPPTTGQKFM